MTFSCRTQITTSAGGELPGSIQTGKSWSSIKAQVRKSWCRFARQHGPAVTVTVELFQVDLVGRTEKPIARLSGRHGDKPSWRKLQGD